MTSEPDGCLDRVVAGPWLNVVVAYRVITSVVVEGPVAGTLEDDPAGEPVEGAG